MSQSFSLARDRCAVISDPALREEIQSHTENAEVTAGILRSIDRFGADPRIQRYEITPRHGYRSARTSAGVSWTVHAVWSQLDANQP